MGCDIHVHTEVKIDGEWHHYSTPNVSRNYALFAYMADVRNWPQSEITPISDPKGLPSDASFLTKFDSDYWGDTFGWFFGNTFAGFKKYPEDAPKQVEDVRLVFWFDN